MQLGLVALALVMLSSLCSSSTENRHEHPALPKARRHKRVSTEGPPPCPKGCERCSEYNGCVKCKPKLFIFLERNDIRQIGVCLASCPMGYFGMRNPETNRCTQCKIENCEACFNRNFCTKCKEGFYSHRGRCHMTCPPGLTSTNGTMECIGQPVVECELSDWSAWGPCMKKNKTCGFKKGSHARLRQPLQTAPQALPASPPCGPQTERKKCVVEKMPCTRAREYRNYTGVDWVWLGSQTATDTKVPDFPACKQCRASVSQSDDGSGFCAMDLAQDQSLDQGCLFRRSLRREGDTDLMCFSRSPRRPAVQLLSRGLAQI
ncbi:R-spondin-1 [Merluccius polli]|uniref:R-spondin-1 n=1 Tax=Merluccius polli TaxID=89951 RepID=A0AA47NM59_MERPO|nr:R-spondin-1 [Merluccius polli]